MNMNQLIAFKAVYEYQSFSKAAEALGITQSGITQLIQNLEKELECALFIRTNRPITVTEKAKIYYQYVEKIVNLHEESLKSLKNPKTDNFILSYRTVSGGIVDIFIFSKPSIKLPEIISISPDEFNSTSKWKENHLYYIRKDIVKSKNIYYTAIHHSSIYAVVSSVSPLAEKKSLEFEDLKGYTVMLPEAHSRTVFAQKMVNTLKKYPEITINESGKSFDLSLRYASLYGYVLFCTEEFVKNHNNLLFIKMNANFDYEYGFACIGTPTKEMKEFILFFKNWYHQNMQTFTTSK